MERLEAVGKDDSLRGEQQVSADAKVDVSENLGQTPLVTTGENDCLDMEQYLLMCGATIDSCNDSSWTPLMWAADKGHLDVVRFLVECGAAVGDWDGSGETPLMKATRAGHLEVVRFLVECGAAVDSCNHDGWTSLMWAARGGHLDVVRFLVEHEAAVDARDSEGCTLLMWAARAGNLDIVQLLVECGASFDTCNHDGWTSLMWAADKGHLGVVRFLVECGAAVDTCNNSGWTLLMWAADKGHLDVVRYLVEHGATIDSCNDSSWTPLMWAADKGHLDVVRFLVECGAAVDTCNHDGWTSLMWAADKGHLDVVRFLVECGAAVDSCNHDGWTSLMWAARGGHLDVVRFLVECGAAVDTCNNSGWTPLMWAADKGHLNVVRFLVECGAAVDSCNDSSWTPLMWAADKGHLDVVRFLVECGAAVDDWDGSGETPLMKATRAGHLEVVRFLVECGAAVDSCNHDGWTSLMWAARGGHLDVVRFLVEHEAAVDARDSEGCTLLMWAARAGNLDIVQLLVEHGANTQLMSAADGTALSCAFKFGRQEVVQFLLPLVRYQDRRTQTQHLDENVMRISNIPSSWVIPPFEVEVKPFIDDGNIGGDYRGKWLDADVVVKLFVDDTTSATFVDEVRLWHKLRHPNILKLYGVCDTCHHLFVCEYASNGSLPEFLKSCDVELRTPWKYLYEAALGLEYLHERKIVHGHLRGSNILIGSDGLAKLSSFGMNASSTTDTTIKSGAWVRWTSPECLEGNEVSFASDVYSLGMCIIETVSGKVPYDLWHESTIKLAVKNKDDGMRYLNDQLAHLTDEQLKLVSAMCDKDPRERLQSSAVVNKIERLADMEMASVTQETDPDFLVGFDEFENGKMNSLWSQVQTLTAQSENYLYQLNCNELALIYDTLKAESQPWSTLERFHNILAEHQFALDTMSQQSQIRQLSATRARDHSFQGLHRRITQLLQLVRPQDQDAEARETEWKRLCREQVEVFVSEASEACVMLSSVDSEEDLSALVAVLRAELRNIDEKYTEKQLAVLQKTYDGIVSKSIDAVQLATTPEWFIPWFELEMNEMATLGEGGFGSVIKAKWLDSEVVVKKLEVADKDSANENKKREMRQMFEREVDIWFGLSHPHVVRLFGACHVGRPFFVCELAPNGTLVEYLRRHPDELWSKLREAALGVQYLHARGIVHGDLKCNNIMIGSDRKAKVTDFGLSGVFGDESKEVVLSGAWHWVAPECILKQKPTFASDIYSLGMCIIEALRVVNGDNMYTPWGALPNAAVKHHVTKSHRLPQRPKNCSDEAWTLIERMCKCAPTDRMLIITVVDELEKLAGRHGDLSTETNEMFGDNGEVRRSLLSVADELAEMKSWIGNCGAKQDWEGSVLLNIYQLLWDRLEQVATQAFPGGDGTVVSNITISDLNALVEHSKQRTRTALAVTDVISLIKFTELALGGYALHRRLDKFMAAHAVRNEPSSLHDWTSACSAFMGVSKSPTLAFTNGDCDVNEAIGAGKRTASSTEVTAAL